MVLQKQQQQRQPTVTKMQDYSCTDTLNENDAACGREEQVLVAASSSWSQCGIKFMGDKSDLALKFPGIEYATVKNGDTYSLSRGR